MTTLYVSVLLCCAVCMVCKRCVVCAWSTHLWHIRLHTLLRYSTRRIQLALEPECPVELRNKGFELGYL